MTRPILPRGLLLLALAALCSSGALAQDDKRASREREALRRAQQQVQRANQEIGTLQQQLGTAEQARSELGAQVEAAQQQARSESARGQRLSRELAAASSERDALQKDKAALEAQVKTLGDRVARLERDLATANERGRTLDARYTTQGKALEACTARSEGLYSTGRALIEDCRTHHADKPALSLEAFTGLRRVGLENVLQSYRDKLDEHKPLAPATAN
jgi:chromosome segregation ATPase